MANICLSPRSFYCKLFYKNKRKEKWAYNKFYLKFKDFKAAVTQFFDDKVWLSEEFENILTDNFQIIRPDFSGFYS